jgi:predicted negative regulator of RcsB-dependent stress response
MRRLQTAGFVLGSIAFLVPVTARAQDVIRYLDLKTMKEASATGTIQQESPSQVSYRPGTATANKDIPALEIIDVSYDVPGSIRLIYKSALSDERKASDPTTKDADGAKALADAIKGLQEILPRLASDKYKFASRHVQFKIARLLARQAEYDPAQMDVAIAALQKFRKEHADGWQISSCAKLLARLQAAKGDAEGARITYEELAAVPNLPSAVRQECDLLAADALLEGKRYAEAEKKLQGLLAGPSDDARGAKIRIYLARCQAGSGKLPEAVKQLEGLIAGTTDKSIKAAAYNALGDCYRSQGRGKDALWQYLWVDVIYHQDRDEHLKAMEHLAKLFEEQGDKTRAKEYRDKVKRRLNELRT